MSVIFVKGEPARYKGAPGGDAKGGVLHMFGCSPRWRGRWQERVWTRIGGAVQWKESWEERSGLWASEYKSDLWEAVCWYGQGLEGFEMLGGKYGEGVEGEKFERWRERLVKWKKMIEEMEGEPMPIQVGERKTGLWPDLKRDVRILTTGLRAWPIES